MSLFCGKKCRCKNRCRSWFQHDLALLDGCEAACKSGDTDIATAEEYLDVYAPWYQEQEEQEFSLTPYLIFLGALLVGLILVYVWKQL